MVCPADTVLFNTLETIKSQDCNILLQSIPSSLNSSITNFSPLSVMKYLLFKELNVIIFLANKSARTALYSL